MRGVDGELPEGGLLQGFICFCCQCGSSGTQHSFAAWHKWRYLPQANYNELRCSQLTGFIPFRHLAHTSLGFFFLLLLLYFFYPILLTTFWPQETFLPLTFLPSMHRHQLVIAEWAEQEGHALLAICKDAKKKARNCLRWKKISLFFFIIPNLRFLKRCKEMHSCKHTS